MPLRWGKKGKAVLLKELHLMKKWNNSKERSQAFSQHHLYTITTFLSGRRRWLHRLFDWTGCTVFMFSDTDLHLYSPLAPVCQKMFYARDKIDFNV